MKHFFVHLETCSSVDYGSRVHYFYTSTLDVILYVCLLMFCDIGNVYCVAFTVAKSKVAKKDLTVPREAPELNMKVCQGLNIYGSGEDPHILEESQYPTWLWTLLDSPDNLTPDDKRYWRRLRKARLRANNNLLKRR